MFTMVSIKKAGGMMFVDYNWFENKKDAINKLESLRGGVYPTIEECFILTKSIQFINRCIEKEPIINKLNKMKQNGKMTLTIDEVIDILNE